jgi:hypothetical protein
MRVRMKRRLFASIAIAAVAMACAESEPGAGSSEASASTAGDSESMAGDSSFSTGSGGSNAGHAGTDAKAGSESSGSAGSGGSAGADSAGAGGSIDSSGTGGTGAAAGAGDDSAGAGGGSGRGGCRSSADCPNVSSLPGGVSITTCLSPGQSPPGPSIVCGAPGWCGRCDCPPQPQPLNGNGLVCETSADCPAGDAAMRAASVCALGKCAECETDADCPAELPACAPVGGGSVQMFNKCLECMMDTHCPAEKPHCVNAGGIGGVCRSCASNAECELGVCGTAGCVAQCNEDSECMNPLMHCVNQRCEVIACSDSSVCAVNAECRDGSCARRLCAVDADCAEGVCVNAACFEELGRCFTQTYLP